MDVFSSRHSQWSHFVREVEEDVVHSLLLLQHLEVTVQRTVWIHTEHKHKNIFSFLQTLNLHNNVKIQFLRSYFHMPLVQAVVDQLHWVDAWKREERTIREPRTAYSHSQSQLSGVQTVFITLRPVDLPELLHEAIRRLNRSRHGALQDPTEHRQSITAHLTHDSHNVSSCIILKHYPFFKWFLLLLKRRKLNATIQSNV